MTKPLENVQRLFLRLGVEGERHGFQKSLRGLVVHAARLARKPWQLIGFVKGMKETADFLRAEFDGWIDPSDIEAGRGGPFDACDLRHWLALANRAGVKAIPAIPILRLEESQISALSGSISLPDVPSLRRLAALAAANPRIATRIAAGGSELLRSDPLTEDLVESTYAAMDDVPDGWMVRSNRSGGTELKTLAGLGAVSDEAPEVAFGPDLMIGPGYIRHGNRRRINTSDMRTLQSAARGPGFLVFLARPWTPTSRAVVADDPNRSGTPIAGNGRWPSEWRAFVEDGRVVGVSSYYSWIDHPTPERARMALQVADLAQRIANEAVTLGATPRYPDVELGRRAQWFDEQPQVREALETRFSRDAVSCTLDFLETEDGPVLLEGGPACAPLPFGGGHPCGFAGTGMSSDQFAVPAISGVAFRSPASVVIADPRTWSGEHDPEGCVLPWEDVRALAAK